MIAIWLPSGSSAKAFPTCIALSLDRPGRQPLAASAGVALLDVRHGHGVDAVAGVIRIADDVQPAAIGHLPHHFILAGDTSAGRAMKRSYRVALP
jgi:hypothetical protein